MACELTGTKSAHRWKNRKQTAEIGKQTRRWTVHAGKVERRNLTGHRLPITDYRSPPVKSDFDSPWKDILETYFQPALELCFPQIARQINWSKGV